MSAAATPIRAVRRPTLRSPRFLRTVRGKIGSAMLLFVLAVALLGPLVAPHPLAQPIGIPGAPPGNGAPLGTDFLGRDVLSRLLHGGLPVIWVAVVATLATYLVGVSIGMLAALSRSWLDPVLMRLVDLFIVFPPLLLLLVLIAGAGTSIGIVLIGIVLVLAPGVARIVRSATLEVSTLSYVEAAIIRGERTPAIMRREVLPNIMPSIIADAGVRFIYAIFIVASLNFLGLGEAPPAANWGLMIAENRVILNTNIWAVATPALMLALLSVSVNLIGDAYVHTLEWSGERA
jgi:ABC-type dipeptide/oligopeptide/nickel transport system permease subunit